MKYLRYITVIFILSMLGIGYAYAHVARLAFIDYSGFHNIGGNLYLSQSLPDSAKAEVTSLLEIARSRVASRYGEPIAFPVTVVLGSSDEQRSYGLYGSPGALLFTPWENYLLLDYETADINVAAHELVHAEVVHRVGYLKRQFTIPTWFDEGAAMQVDHRPMYSYEGSIEEEEFHRIVSLDTPKKFLTNDKNQNIDNYRSAKMAVAEIFSSTDNELYSILEKVRRGEGGVVVSAANETNKALQRTSR